MAMTTFVVDVEVQVGVVRRVEAQAYRVVGQSAVSGKGDGHAICKSYRGKEQPNVHAVHEAVPLARIPIPGGPLR